MRKDASKLVVPNSLPKPGPICEKAKIDPTILRKWDQRRNDRSGLHLMVCENLAGYDDSNEDEIIKWKDSENAASVEAGEVVRGLAGVHENSGDKETGENEEQVHSYPALGDVPLKIEGGHVQDGNKSLQVMEEDEDDRHCAQPFKRLEFAADERIGSRNRH